jgi:hypothetical protein
MHPAGHTQGARNAFFFLFCYQRWEQTICIASAISSKFSSAEKLLSVLIENSTEPEKYT